MDKKDYVFTWCFLLPEQQSLPAIREPADYEEVEFGVPTPATPLNSAAVYDVLRRDWEDDDAIYETPTESWSLSFYLFFSGVFVTIQF